MLRILSSSVSKDYLSKYYVGIESIPEDLTKIVDNILFIYELIRRSRVLGTKIPRELISSLRYWVSELVLRLRLNSYLSFEDIGRSIRKYMFRGDVHELELRKFLQLIINLWLKKITGKYDCLDVKDLVEKLKAVAIARGYILK